MSDELNPGYAYSRPFPGHNYIVKQGDTVESIAAQAYGDPNQSPAIEYANFSDIIGDLKTGQTLFIPVLPEREARKKPVPPAKIRTTRDTLNRKLEKGFDSPTLVIGDLEIVPQILSATRSLKTAADGWIALFPWKAGENISLDRVLKPFTYPQAKLFIGQELIINGILYEPRPRLYKDKGTMTIVGYSYTVDAVDSTLKPPYEVEEMTLEARVNDLVAPLGIRAIFNDPSGGPFDRMTAHEGDTIFKHSSKLAHQRGLMVSSTPGGDFLFTKAEAENNVGELREGENVVIGWEGSFNGRERYNIYRAVMQTPDEEFLEGIAVDSQVPRARFLTFRADETTAGNIKKAAEVKRSRQLAKALGITLTVVGWIAPNGTIWKDNTLVTIYSKTLFVPGGVELLITTVKLRMNPDKGKFAILNLEPPQAFNDEPVEDPWSE